MMLKILVWEDNYYKAKSSEQRATADVPITQIVSAFNPSDKQPTKDEVSKYQVQKEEPRYIDIKRLDIHARTIITEADTNGILAVPDNIYDVNWYSGSSKPGQNGYIIMSGIHSSKDKKGVFADLDSLEENDEITIENGAGDKYTYIVKEINIISNQKDSNAVLAKMQTRLDDKETLSLVTVKTTDSRQTFESLVMLRATLKK